jgi:small subunit ribosomal protein S20
MAVKRKNPSAIKRHRQSEERRVRNRAIRARVRGAIKDVRAAATGANLAQAEATLRIAERLLTKAVTKGVVHRNAASRHLSRLSRHVNVLRKSSAR